MRSVGRFFIVILLVVFGALSCDSPTGLPDVTARLVWVTPPPATLREGDAATVAVELRDAGGRPLLTLDGAAVTLRFVFSQDSQPGTACGAACATTVTQGRAQMTVAWVSAGSWTAIACVRPAAPADSACVQAPLAVTPVQAALVAYPADSVGRRVRFPLEARLRLPDGSAVADLARTVRLRFTSSAPPADHARCPEAGPVCERVAASGVVRLDSVVVLDTAATSVQACAIAPNGHERCDPAGPRAFRVVIPPLTLRFTTQPGGGSVGVPFATQPVIEALEPDGTRRTDFTGLVSAVLASDETYGPALAGTGADGFLARRIVTARAVAGLATFTALRVNRIGLGYRLVASSTGAAPINSGLFGASLDASVLDVVKNGGDAQYALAGTTVPVRPSVAVFGPLTDRIIGVPIFFKSGGWGVLTDSVTVSDTSGVARLGAWTLAASPDTYTGERGTNILYAGIEEVVRQTFFAEAVEVAQIGFVVEPADTLAAGDTIGPAVVVELRDARGRRVFGATDAVQLTAMTCEPDFDCQVLDVSRFLGTKTSSAVNGRASFGDLSITAGWASAEFLLQARAGSATVDSRRFRMKPNLRSASLTEKGGTTRSATVGSTITSTPIMVLRDGYGNPFSGVTVTFTVVMGGGSLTDAVRTTWLGEARPGSWTLGPIAGLNALSAKAEGVADSAVAYVTGTPPAFFARSISGGNDFTCAAATTNLPYCWGNNTYSQLGEGTQTARSRPTQLSGGLLQLTQVTSGFDFACGLAANGSAYCWGNDWYGQLGIDTADVNQHATPDLVVGGHTFQQISAGFRHVCALDTAGVAWCWGAPSEGSVGKAVLTEYPDNPQQVTTTLRFSQIDAGGNTSCAVAESGDIWCWGFNGYGQLGNNSTDARAYVPVKVVGGRSYSEVSVGTFHTCGISEGSVYCWGRNMEGQLGIGYASPSSEGGSPLPVSPLGTLGTARHVSAGNTHTCEVNAGGDVYCWGLNANGQLGDLSTVLRTSAVLVRTDARFVAVTTGLLHSCALTEAGAAFCWGSNASGRLGLGNASNSNITAPTQVVLP